MHAFMNYHKALTATTKSVAKRCYQCQRRYYLRGHKCDRIGYECYKPLIVSSHLLSTFVRVTVSNVSHIPEYRRYANVINSDRCSGLSTSIVCAPSNMIVVRYVSLNRTLFDKEPLKPSSKVEETVNVLKEDLKNEEPASAAPVSKPKKPLMTRIKDELVHYYHGFRLLFIDMRVSAGLVWRVLNGRTLTRREHKLLVRTTADMFRLVPFSVFIIVPFLEFTLPIFLKLFPNMLPSTFQTASEKEEKMKKQLKVKIEMAKFLQKTLDDMAVQSKGRSENAKEFHDFFQKLRSEGIQPTSQEIMKFSKLFEDELTLDALSRQQLVALCRVLEIQPIGTTNMLRFQLRMKLRNLAADDKMIQKEGIDSLNPAELQAACRARGMRAYGMPESKLKGQLAQWLDLHLNEKVPPSLLLLSRALLLPDNIPATDQLKATISSLPDTLATQTKAAIAEKEGKIDNKAKLEAIKEEVRKVKEERQEMREARKEEKKKVPEELVDKAPVITEDTGIPSKSTVEPKKETPAETEKKEVITSSDIGILEDALETVVKDKDKMLLEKEELKDLKEELADYKEDVDDLQDVMLKVDKEKSQITESKAAKRLYRSVNKMIKKMDNVVCNLEKEEEKLKKDLEEKKLLKEAIEVDVEEKKLVSVEELITALKQLMKVPDDSVVERISEVLTKIDVDKDGSIRVDDVLKVVELVSKENVKLNKKQIDEIIELLKKEEIIELEDQIEKALEKEAKQHEIEEVAEAKQAAADSQPVNETEMKVDYQKKYKNTCKKDGKNVKET